MKAKERFIIGGIFIALILGSIVGYFYPDVAVKFDFLGALFFNALYMIIVPLIVASMVVGITALGDLRKLGRTARATLIYFIITSCVAVTIGITLAATFKPGKVSESTATITHAPQADRKIGTIGSFTGKIGKEIDFTVSSPEPLTTRNVTARDLPPGATIAGLGGGAARFRWRPENDQIGDYSITFQAEDSLRGIISETVTISVHDDGTMGVGGMMGRIGDAMVQTLNEMVPRNVVSAAAETQVLALIVFSLLFGGVLSSMGGRGRVVIEFFEVVNDVIMKLVHLVMYLAPFGVFGIVASKVGSESGNLANVAQGIGLFSTVVIIGLLIHAGLLMGALKWLGGRNPFKYFANMSEALGTALGVSSSSATLPVTMECVVEKNRVDQRAASFVLPLGTTINMDGTAMYQAISAIFVCQLFNVPLGVEHYVIILVTAVLASIGTPGLPQAGIVMMSIVMGSVGVPADIIAQGVAIILVVDWALDRARTALNVFGDSVGAAVIANTFEFKTVTGSRGRSEAPQRSSKRESRREQRQDRKRGRRDRSDASERPSRREHDRGDRRSTDDRKPRHAQVESSIGFDEMVAVPNFDLDHIPAGFDKSNGDRNEKRDWESKSRPQESDNETESEREDSSSGFDSFTESDAFTGEAHRWEDKSESQESDETSESSSPSYGRNRRRK